MTIDILTKEDLTVFKAQLFAELHVLLSKTQTKETRQYYKTWEVMRDFNISKSKLQALRDSGKLPFTRIDRCIYFEYADLKNILDVNKSTHGK